MSEVPGTGNPTEGQGGYGPFQSKPGEAPPPGAGPAAEPSAQQPAAAPQPEPGVWSQPAPAANDPWSLFPEDRPGSPSWQPRIVPTPKPSRKRIVMAAIAGALAGLVVFGPTGYFVGYTTAPAPAPKPTAPTPGATSSLAAFERTQLRLNKPKFGADLEPIANSWMPWVANCAKSGDKDGPQLNAGEEARVSCRYPNITVFFVKYKSTDERDKAYAKYLPQNIDAKQLTPGVAEPSTKRTTSGSVNGRYIEFAYKTGTEPDPRPVCGVWWSDEKAPVAAYMLSFWGDGMGESWDPMRDVWRRYS
ncbi:hypothetical protein [Planosporangium mesophilum]|uniref:Uncharacterized protein n=1 Tax=Planosporangium mesophilum TaxID=689768 RepID=A0A8J3TCS8_9ACTN|nr:hypothetical protein [Planosporangium mesophilum]NJC84863.1 hypothetical protein [Planosporangium mesophilum]GII23507.1 hypothetical protein Pme01_31040 [Planosporangium mesophilum]